MLALGFRGLGLTRTRLSVPGLPPINVGFALQSTLSHGAATSAAFDELVSSGGGNIRIVWADGHSEDITSGTGASRTYAASTAGVVQIWTVTGETLTEFDGGAAPWDYALGDLAPSLTSLEAIGAGITGDLSDVPAGVTYLDLQGPTAVSPGTGIWRTTDMEYIRVDANLTSAEVDQVLGYAADIVAWNAPATIDLSQGGNERRTAASDADKAAIEALTATVTVLDPIVIPPEAITIVANEGTITSQSVVGDDVTFTISGSNYDGTYTVSRTALETGLPLAVVAPSQSFVDPTYTLDLGLWIAPEGKQPFFKNEIQRQGSTVAVDTLTYTTGVNDTDRPISMVVTAQNTAGAVSATVVMQVGLTFAQNGVVMTNKSFIRNAAPLVITPRTSAIVLVSHNMPSGDNDTRNLMLVGTSANAIQPIWFKREGNKDRILFNDGGGNLQDFGPEFDDAATQVTTIAAMTAGGTVDIWQSHGDNFEKGNGTATLSSASIDLSDPYFEYPHVQTVGTFYRGALWLTDSTMPDFTSDEFRDSIVQGDGTLAHPSFAYQYFGGPGAGLLFDFYGDAADAAALSYVGDLKTENAITLRSGGSIVDA